MPHGRNQLPPRGPGAASRAFPVSSNPPMVARRGVDGRGEAAMDGFRIAIDALVDHGAGLTRPECVLCLKSGTVFTSNGEGGVTRIGADGAVRPIVAPEGAYRPMTNGFALTAEGDFLLADLRGDGVWRLGQDGACSPFLQHVDGVRLGSTNFVGIDAKGRVWATVSTRLEPRQRAMLDFVVKVTNRPAEMVEADRQALRDIGFSDPDIWDISEVAAFFNMTNRMSLAIDMLPNPEYHGMTR